MEAAVGEYRQPECNSFNGRRAPVVPLRSGLTEACRPAVVVIQTAQCCHSREGQRAKGPGSEGSREREVQGANRPGSESSRERIGHGSIGRFAPGSEWARERKGCESFSATF